MRKDLGDAKAVIFKAGETDAPLAHRVILLRGFAVIDRV